MTVLTEARGESSSHVLLLHRREIERQARVVSWVRQGLARGEKILYSTAPGDTLVSALRTGGRDRGRGAGREPGGDPALALRQGQLSFVPEVEFFPGARQAELVHQALDQGYPAVRMSARADVALTHETLDTYQAIDHAMDELCRTLPVSALCQLDAEATGAETMAALIGSHHGQVEDAQMRVSRRSDRVALSGEIDFSSAEVLTEALKGVCRHGSDPTPVLDLSEVTFLDVSGSRALLLGTEELRAAGGTVTLLGVGGHVRKVLTLLEMDRVDGIELS